MSPARTSAVVGRRMCAGLAACTAVLHGAMVGHAGNPAAVMLILAMMAVCLYCARHLWAEGSLGVWCLVALMSLGMIAIHWATPGRHHTSVAAVASVVPQSTLMSVTTVASAAEVLIATAVLLYRTRDRALLS